MEGIGVAISAVDGDIMLRIYYHGVALVDALPIPVVLYLYCDVLTLFEICECQVSWHQFWFAPIGSECAVDEDFYVLFWLWVTLVFITILWNHFPDVGFNMYPEKIVLRFFGRSYERSIPCWSQFRAPKCLFIINIIPVVAISSVVEIHCLSKALKTLIEVKTIYEEHSRLLIKSIVGRIDTIRYLSYEFWSPALTVIYIPLHGGGSQLSWTIGIT